MGQMWNRAFPTEKIKKGSRVVLYGAGKEGRSLWHQNQFLGWCEICTVIDRQGYDVKDFPVKVFPVQKIMDAGDFAYVIVAIGVPEYRKDAVETLLSLGVPRLKIIDDISAEIPPEQNFSRNKKLVGKNIWTEVNKL